MRTQTEAQEKAHREFNDAVAQRQAEEIAAARQANDIPLHERTPEQRRQADAETIAAANQPTPEQLRAANLALEKAHQATENWMRAEEAGADRYEVSAENSARLHAVIQQLHGGHYTEANLAAAFDYAIANRIIAAKPAAEKQPKSLREWAAVYGYTVAKIQATPAPRLRELLKDDFQNKLIHYVLANRIGENNAN